MVEEQHILTPGYRLEDYEIIKTLGVGGFGVTYLANDLNLHKQMAIKEYFPNEFAVRQQGSTVLPKSQGGKDDFEWGLTRFLDEARVLARFDHPNIVRVSRFFRANNTAYIVMEYLDGEPLSEFLAREAPLNEAELKALLWPIMDGLDVVHAADYLHRDIKPENIILRPDGSPVLLDFGAARLATGGKSKALSVILTPGYAPIEQYSEKSAQGPYTDIYALAAVCYRAILNERPQDASDRVLNDQTPRLADAGLGGWSPTFLSALDTALALRPGDRPQNLEAWHALMGADEEIEQSSEPVSRFGMSPEMEANLYRPDGGTVAGARSGTTASPPPLEPNTQEFPENDEHLQAMYLTLPLGDWGQDIPPAEPGSAEWNTAMELFLAAVEEESELEDEMLYPVRLKELHEKAAYLGLDEAQFRLAQLHYTGQGTRSDFNEAARWFRLAASQGYTQAMSALAAMMRERGQPQDFQAADMLLQQAASEGDQFAAILDTPEGQLATGLHDRAEPPTAMKVQMSIDGGAMEELSLEKSAESESDDDPDWEDMSFKDKAVGCLQLIVFLFLVFALIGWLME